MFLCGLATWVVISSVLNLTQLIRSLIQPWVCRQVDSGTGFVLRVQKWKHWSLDVFFSLLSCVVSVPFYTGFLPLLFWVISFPWHGLRSFEFCLCGLIILPGRCCRNDAQQCGFKPFKMLENFAPSSPMSFVLAFEISFGMKVVMRPVAVMSVRMLYQPLNPAVRLFEELLLPKMRRKMHKNMDCLLLTLLTRSAYLVTYFWSALSFEFHTYFNAVALGIVAGVNQSYHQFHHEDVPSLFSQLSFPHFIGRVLVGIPTILLVKLCGKALAKRIVPLPLYMTGITIRSSSYIPSLDKKAGKPKNSGHLQKLFFLSSMESVDVDTPIRFLQYAGLAWSVVDLAPALFSRMNL
ncbi:Lipid phosphate phosphatase delta-like protein [Drosera capensis]